MICILWKEEYIDLTLVLTEAEEKNNFYKTWSTYDQKQYIIFLKKYKKRRAKKGGKFFLYKYVWFVNLHFIYFLCR